MVADVSFAQALPSTLNHLQVHKLIVIDEQMPDTKPRSALYAVIAGAIVLGTIRPFLVPHPVSLQGSYEAIAHVFVGGIIGAWLVSRARWLLVIGIAITVVEVVSAAIGVLSN